MKSLYLFFYLFAGDSYVFQQLLSYTGRQDGI